MLTTPRLTIRQPHADLIAHGHKRILTTVTPTTYTGPIRLYSSDYTPSEEERDSLQSLTDWYGLNLPARHRLSTLIATATLQGCTPTNPQNHSILERALSDFTKPYTWHLADVEPVGNHNYLAHLLGRIPSGRVLAA